MTIIIIMTAIVLSLALFYVVMQKTTLIVPEDKNAVLANKNGFIKRVLPAGVHHLKLGREHLEFFFDTKPKLVKGQVIDMTTAEGISVVMDWSGVYQCEANLIKDQVSQRLRNLPKAENALQRQVDLTLRRLLGTYNVQALFKPSVRERIERQLTETVKAKLAPMGIVLFSLDLQAVHLPDEVNNAFNQAKAIQTLDEAIRASDRTTRNIVTASHKVEELLEWEKLLPPYGRYILSGQGETVGV